MGMLEIVLLIIGGVIFALSFVITANKEEVSESTKALAKSEIEQLVSQEMNNIRSHVDDVVGESMEYAMEKTERSLERLSNEKIMAVNEYSDTVLKEIQRNHEEVMFLYDMLNDKHTNLKNTVSEVNKTVKEAEAKVKEAEVTKKEAEVMVQTFQKLTPEIINLEDYLVAEENTPADADIAISEDYAENESDNTANESSADGRNNNIKILEMYRQGMSQIEIAKELGLGVGEVKLVLDLYRNIVRAD